MLQNMARRLTTLELNSILTFGSTRRKDKLHRPNQLGTATGHSDTSLFLGWQCEYGFRLPVETVSVGVKVTGRKKDN